MTDRGPAAEIARACRSGVGPAPRSSTQRAVRPAALRLAITTALACAVWAGAVGTAVATTDGGPGLIHAIGHGLDLDDLGHGHHADHLSHAGYVKGRHS